MLTSDQARQEILRRATVTHQLVTLAKAFLLSPDRPHKFRPADLMGEFANLQGYERIEPVVLHQSVNLEPQLDQVAGYLACIIAFAQALWEILPSGYYMHAGAWTPQDLPQGWTTIVRGSGGGSAGWRFEEVTFVLPGRLYRSPYWMTRKPESIIDPDIFLLEAGVEGADPEIQEALQDAVRCLRQGLYRPAVTVLGKAMEGAWIELGLGLATALPNDVKGNSESEKIERYMKDENRGIARKINDVRTLYQQRDLVGPIVKTSGIRPEVLESAVIWSDVVREARNAIHFGAKPTTANSYEKAAVLFLDGAKSLRMMYQISNATK